MHNYKLQQGGIPNPFNWGEDYNVSKKLYKAQNRFLNRFKTKPPTVPRDYYEDMQRYENPGEADVDANKGETVVDTKIDVTGGKKHKNKKTNKKTNKRKTTKKCKSLRKKTVKNKRK